MKLAVCVAVFSVVLLSAAAQKATSDLQAMLDTERAFARMSVEKGIRPAFMAFIADDGILFRPKAVKGKRWMTEHPVPPSDKKPLLTWRPSFAYMSLSGDMGYTFGPWEYKDDAQDAAPSGYGHFITIWKKQTDGSWKFAVDLGVSHPSSQEAELPATLPAQKFGGTLSKQRRSSLQAAFLEQERGFARLAATEGARHAFHQYATTDVRLFREGKAPMAGLELAAGGIPEGAGVWTWQLEGSDVSQLNDLAYSYGTYELKDTGTQSTESGNYFRIWKKQNGIWKVVVDVANPIPPK